MIIAVGMIVTVLVVLFAIMFICMWDEHGFVWTVTPILLLGAFVVDNIEIHGQPPEPPGIQHISLCGGIPCWKTWPMFKEDPVAQVREAPQAVQRVSASKGVPCGLARR